LLLTYHHFNLIEFTNLVFLIIPHTCPTFFFSFGGVDTQIPSCKVPQLPGEMHLRTPMTGSVGLDSYR
jgi:hypothetical protein